MSFIGYTIGLQTSAGFIKAEYTRTASGVTIKAVSANSLGAVHSVKRADVSAADFEARPVDPYNSTSEAIWAFNKLGVEI